MNVVLKNTLDWNAWTAIGTVAMAVTTVIVILQGCWQRKDDDKWTRRHVIEHGALAFECGNCRHLAQVDVLDLVAKFGPEAIVGVIRVRMVCRRCWEATSSVAGTDESRPQGSRVGYQWRRARGHSAG
jgi:hypothetical protein